MKKLVLAAALLAGGSIGLQGSSHAHGGQYRGPGDTVPPGGGGSGGGAAGPASGPAGPTTPGPTTPGTPGAGAPGAPGGAPGSKPTSGAGGDSGGDLTLWSFWWEFNKEPYLNLKAAIDSGGAETGSEGWFLGQGEKKQSKDSQRPTQAQIRQTVVPALLAALEKETNNDIVTGCMIALAKIGDPASETGDSQFEPVIARFLKDKNQEISETAAVALGILANPKSIPLLKSLIEDSPAGRTAVGSNEVNYRTRAFAAYGLGLIGAKTSDPNHKKEILTILRKQLESDSTRTRDTRVSCIIALGMVPHDTIETPAGVQPEKKGAVVPPENSRVAQLDYLLAYLQNDANEYLVRAHCPTSMARLLPGLTPELTKTYREKIAADLLERISSKSKEKAEVVQSSVLALGLIGTNDKADPTDKKIIEALLAVPKDISDQQTRNYSMIAMAKVAATTSPTAKDAEGGADELTKALFGQLSGGKGNLQSWAGLACGVMGNQLKKSSSPNAGRIGSLQMAVRTALAEEKSGEKLGAYAISAGIMGDVEATRTMMTLLDKQKDETARGYLAIGLGLMNAREAVEQIQKIVDESKYKPDLLKQAAIALGLLGDKAVVETLIKNLTDAKGLATQAALSSALGFIGDHRSIDPLVTMLQNDSLTDGARG
ncbi:MAG: HEAT repeat domain-containing protein, partial [Planctomycetota bacterium]